MMTTYFPNATTNSVTRAVHHLARWVREDYFAWGRRVTSLDNAKLENFFGNTAEVSHLDSESVANYESYLLCALRIATWATVVLPALGGLVLLVDEIVWNYTAIEFDYENQPPMVNLFNVGADSYARRGSRFDCFMPLLKPIQKALFDSSGSPDKNSPKLFLRYADGGQGIMQPENGKKMVAFIIGNNEEEIKSYKENHCKEIPAYSAHSRIHEPLDKASRLFLEYVITQL